MAVARGTLAVLGKGSKTRPVLVPDSLFEELSALALPDPDAPLFRSQKKGPDGGPREPRHGPGREDTPCPGHARPLGHSTSGKYLHARPDESSALYLGS
jgi:hypothetical protein